MLKKLLLCGLCMTAATVATAQTTTWDCTTKEDPSCKGCSWIDRGFPLENVCEATFPDPYMGCSEGGPGRNCSETFDNPPNTEKKCAVYWNYIGALGSQGNCSLLTSGNSCGEEELQGASGGPVPDACTLTYGS